MATRLQAGTQAQKAARDAVRALELAHATCVAMGDTTGAATLAVALEHARAAEAWLQRDIVALPEYWEREVGSIPT